MTMEAFTTPVNYKDYVGEWAVIDSRFVASDEEAYEYENAANGFKAQIPADPTSTPVRFSVDDDSWVSMRFSHRVGLCR